MSLHGCWILNRCTISYSDHRPDHHPFQKGMISYHPNGYMQACLSVAPRTKLSNENLEYSFALSQQEKSLCFDQYLSYAGTYTVEKHHVHHHVQQSLHPMIIGKKLTRKYIFHDQQLILTYTHTVRPSLSCIYTLQWSKP